MLNANPCGHLLFVDKGGLGSDLAALDVASINIFDDLSDIFGVLEVHKREASC